MSHLAVLSSIALAATASAQAPLGEAERRLAEAVASEPTPEPDEHYLTSNEWRHDLWFEPLRDLGGAFVGVGTDQCLTLAAVQNASLVWIVDYDAEVAHVHRMYRVLVLASPTAQELLARFRRDEARSTMALLERELGNEARGVARVYRRNRGAFEHHLRHLARLRRAGRPTSWLSDPALYARVRALYAAGRVIARTGDVTGGVTLRGVGAAARALGVTVRALYFSNAEQFFRYDARFAENMRSLPTDERTLVLRTFRFQQRIQYAEDDTWHYMVHPMPDFLARLALGYRRNTQIVMDAMRGGLGREGVTFVGPRTPRDYAVSP